jgi:hypothetical protein
MTDFARTGGADIAHAWSANLLATNNPAAL